MMIDILAANTMSEKKVDRPFFIERFVSQGMNRLVCLLLFSALALTACSQAHQVLPQSGTSDYRHYPEGGGLFVSAAFGPDGRLWRIVPEKHHVYVDYSIDLGKSFSSPVEVNKESQAIKVSGENRPGIVVDGSGRITVIYAAESNQPVVLYYSISSDNGRSFSTPSPLSDKALEANNFQGRLVLNSSGQAFAFWHDERDRTDWQQLGNSIYYTGIRERNDLHTAALKLSDTVCDCCRLGAAFDGNGQPVVLARFIYPGRIRDHGLLRAQKNGAESVSRRVTFDNWAIEACPEHGPSITISDENRYHITWFTQGEARKGLFYAYSLDQGEHFSEPFPIGNGERLPNHPDVIAQGTHVVIAWTEFDGLKTHLIVLQSNDGGENWSKPQTIAEVAAEADFPFLLSKNRDIFVSWNSKTEGYRLIPLY
jgi:hypothetical protein